jgi:hypothetical protein
MEIGTSEAEPIWTEFLRKLTRCGLRGVKLVISNAHEGIKAAVIKVLCATCQRCRVHFMRCAGPCRKERAQGRLCLHRNGLCLAPVDRKEGFLQEHIQKYHSRISKVSSEQIHL